MYDSRGGTDLPSVGARRSVPSWEVVVYAALLVAMVLMFGALVWHATHVGSQPPRVGVSQLHENQVR